MMQVTEIGFLIFPIIFLLIFAKISTVYYALLITMVFEQTTMIYIGDNCIFIYQLIWVILVVKFVIKSDFELALLPRHNLLQVFIVYAGISMLFAIFNSDVAVKDVVDGKYRNISFGSSQFFQYAYLMMGFFITIITWKLLRNKIIYVNEVVKKLILGETIAILFAVVQHKLPIEFVNKYIRNSTLLFYNYSNEERVTSFFGEPSFFAFFVTPILGVIIYRCVKKYNLAYILLIVITLAVFFSNMSSTFLIGIVTCFGIFLLFTLLEGKITKKQILIFCLMLLIGSGIIITNIEKISEMMISTQDKLNGTIQGYDRLDSLKYHLNVFLNHPVWGVGFGTLRSYDLLTTFLAEMGIVGNFFFYAYIIKRTVELFKMKDEESKEIIILIAATVVMMLVSIPEYSRFYLWIYFGIAEFLCDQHRKKHFEGERIYEKD